MIFRRVVDGHTVTAYIKEVCKFGWRGLFSNVEQSSFLVPRVVAHPLLQRIGLNYYLSALINCS